MRLHAYVLAGDPAWAGHSVSSYYELVERIIVSYDASGRSWAGHPLLVEESLDRLLAADPDGKMVLLPGNHANPARLALEVETEQRQEALDAAADGADWVLQFDTDEIALAPSTFRSHLLDADTHGAMALHYPLRDFYQHVAGDRYLEHCGPLWRSQAAFPGPLAVRSGVRLSLCRQARVPLYRVDMRPWNTDPAHPRSAAVHAVVSPRDAVAHMSWVRTPEQMERKSRTSGHAGERDWEAVLSRWRWRRRHPWLTMAPAPLARDPFERFRVSSLNLSTVCGAPSEPVTPPLEAGARTGVRSG
jgi:hypothetical protein